MKIKKIRELFLLKTKFATTSLIATSVEYGLYTLLTFSSMALKPAQIISYGCGMLVNFLLQKRFVFELKRKLSSAFIGAMAVSLGGMAINFGIYSFLLRFPFFMENHYFAKLGATGIVFFYNFYMKRYVFERKFV